MSTTTELTELKINYLTEAQYQAEVSGGTIDENALYMTPTSGETDPTVPAWAKASSKPVYTASEVGAQPTLVSGTNIKTINNESLLGSGNISISGGSSGWNDISNHISSSYGNIRAYENGQLLIAVFDTFDFESLELSGDDVFPQAVSDVIVSGLYMGPGFASSSGTYTVSLILTYDSGWLQASSYSGAVSEGSAQLILPITGHPVFA